MKEIGFFLLPNLVPLPVYSVAYGPTIDGYLETYEGTLWEPKHCSWSSSQSISKPLIGEPGRALNAAKMISGNAQKIGKVQTAFDSGMKQRLTSRENRKWCKSVK